MVSLLYAVLYIYALHKINGAINPMLSTLEFKNAVASSPVRLGVVSHTLCSTS